MIRIFLLAVLIAISGCTATEKGAAIGGASGAIIGGAVTGDAGGAIVGGAAGAIAGALIGRATERGKCYYHDGRGGRYIADC